MSMAYEEYMKQIVKPMRAELTNAGFEELTTESEVDELMKDSKETTFIVVNSVCGCAAGLARPAATQAALNAEKKPGKLVTVFAGQDKEATSRMREYFEGYEPSSPSMALMKNGEVVHFIPRHDIEGNSIENIMENLQNAFDKHC
ncbi:putative YphP/YqiW family bacilliredoxin [Metabacillus crassostreae]|uniref:BrxA/BrxB family bacilliredoxin n=1 Tax=Metabacillus crassostreae TaxID=929098 RepID=UPI00195D7398|nr:BrxA/BrxB family bacilliredoxin [Metabacillus crassostreae]MBM7602092.1 putative YphP/YqiW family bacilliredoxin [Metabacillus crassostreae]